MNSFVKKAELSNAKEVLHILSSCTKWLLDQGMDHWVGAHDLEKVKKRIREKEVYLLYEKQEPIATITLSSNPAFYYKEEDKNFWKNLNAISIYLSGLAVLPKYQEKGCASKLLAFAEKIAIERKTKYVRFDAVCHYKGLIDFYINRAYKIKGQRLTGKTQSYFFEKEL